MRFSKTSVSPNTYKPWGNFVTETEVQIQGLKSTCTEWTNLFNVKSALTYQNFIIRSWFSDFLSLWDMNSSAILRVSVFTFSCQPCMFLLISLHGQRCSGPENIFSSLPFYYLTYLKMLELKTKNKRSQTSYESSSIVLLLPPVQCFICMLRCCCSGVITDVYILI